MKCVEQTDDLCHVITAERGIERDAQFFSVYFLVMSNDLPAHDE